MLFNFKAHIYHISLLIWIHTKTIKVEKFQTPEKTPKEKNKTSCSLWLSVSIFQRLKHVYYILRD